MKLLPLGAILPVALVSLFLVGGCASDEPPRTGPHAAHRPPLPPLSGQTVCFAGRILVEMKLGAMTGFNNSGDGSRSEEHGHGMRRQGGGGNRPRGDRGEPNPEGGDLDQPRSNLARRAENMGSPPVMIHLRFTNKSSEPADLVVADFLSPLGNFVVNPEKLAIGPGQTIEVDPMTSRLAGEISGVEITLRLRLDGKEETIIVALAPESPPAPPENIPAH